MINITEEIIFLTADPIIFQQACVDAIDATCKLYRATFDPKGIHLHDIPSASSKCKFKDLTFPSYINRSQVFDKRWVENALMCANREYSQTDAADTSRVLGYRSILPNTLAQYCINGLRAVLLHLWSKGHLLLPMSFKLPKRKVNKKIIEFANEFYTDVLMFFRAPFCENFPTQPDITIHMRGASLDNLDWYGFRPILGSDWHKPSDVKVQDLNDLNVFLAGQRRNTGETGRKVYSISAHTIAEPLLSAFPSEVSFSASEITTFPVNYVTPRVIQREADASDDPAFAELKKSWLAAEQLYIEFKRRQKIKKIQYIENCIGILNKYLFEELPSKGFTPPSPVEFTDRYVTGEFGIPSSIEFLGKQHTVNKIRQMFEFFEDQNHRHQILNGFRNPITKLDIPIGPSRSVTTKVVFKLSIFRHFLAFIGAIQTLTCDLFHLLHNNAHNPEFNKRFSKDIRNGVLNIADWCECPVVEYVDPRKGVVSYRLQWIPINLLQLGKYRLTNSPSIKIRVPRPHSITNVNIMIETGLRAITSRWLDRARHESTSKPEPDDYLYAMHVSTDKSHGPWVRPTATSVFHLIENFISVQDHFLDVNSAIYLDYDNFKHAPFEKINPLFVLPGQDNVLPEHTLANFYRSIIYAFNVQLKSLNIPTIDPLPSQLDALNFDKESDYVAAHKVRTSFKTDYTPHGMRASVITSHATYLSPELIGRYVSGQNSVQTVVYYTKLDTEYLNETTQLGGLPPSLLLANRGIVLKPDHNVLTTWLTDPVDMPKKLHDLGALTLHADAPRDNTLINIVDITNLRFDFTHICTVGQNCTKEVISTIGKFSCGQCYLSVKTIHHLPAIQAKCRFLGRRIDHTKETLLSTAKITDNERILLSLENDLTKDCAELAAWVASAEVLMNNAEKLKSKSLIYRSNVLDSEIAHVTPSEGPMTRLLLASIDAENYPDLFDETLQRNIREVATRLEVYKGNISSILDIPSGPDLPNYFRGIIGSLCIASNITVEDLSKILNSEVKTEITLSNVLKKLKG